MGLVLLLIVGLFISLAFNAGFFIRVLRPLRQLSGQAARLAEGDFNALEQSCGGVDDIDVLRKAMLAMSAHVQRAQAQSAAYAGALTSGQESERRRIAHELHDDTVQALIAITQTLDFTRTNLDKDTSRAEQLLMSAREQAVEAVNGLRNLIADLRPPALEELGLVAALRTLAEGSQDMKVNLDISGNQRRLDEALELTLFRVVQEGLNNARRHGQAAEATVTVAYQTDGTRLKIKDNGLGFNLKQVEQGSNVSLQMLETLAKAGHYGLIGAQERVEQLRGVMGLTSVVGSGTMLEVYIPFAANEQPADTVRDPVCSTLIQPQRAYGSTEYKGQTYYFCCPVCRGAFLRDPEAYLLSHQMSADSVVSNIG